MPCRTDRYYRILGPVGRDAMIPEDQVAGADAAGG